MTNEIRLFELLSLLGTDVTPNNSKIHLATWNGYENPFDVYLEGRFDSWQCWQSKKNFGRRNIVSFINLGGSRWLFAGVHITRDVQWAGDHYDYTLDEDQRFSGLNGRLIVNYPRKGRQSYRNADSCAERFIVQELLPERVTVGPFPGFKSVLLTHQQLRNVIVKNQESWRTALSSVAGVYLITDTLTGKHYVGSAAGDGGLWTRWASYVTSGHGENKELKRLILDEGIDRTRSFQYSILEIADIHISDENVLQRESHWKRVLLTRVYGLNAN